MSGSAPKVALDADLKLQRFDGSTCVQTVYVETLDDGVLAIQSTGTTPRISWSQLQSARSFLRATVMATGQPLAIQHDGHRIAKITPRGSRSPKWSIHWWTMLRRLLVKR
ncbi:hypothetical protein LOC71_09230 [Rhodopirellula sp. JC740]|uniref:Uncharacterized protein n=1 Tax=Rhodopirellula halodulae TaxID=2894198 RepID=A0ABS8NFX5_9BACT|nr:hypothetical protein [Rhodopirellula sp. JC740]MCC9642455.1 hypothetical protein [Rhodopirellula sp. JC740]